MTPIKKYQIRKRSNKFNLIFVEKSLLKRKEKKRKTIKSRSKVNVKKKMRQKLQMKSFQYVTVASQQLMLYT